MGTVPTNIHTETETQYTIPIHSQFWRPGDVGTLLMTIHTEIDTMYHHYICSFSGYQDIHTGTVTGGVYIQIYVYIFIYIY